MSNETDQQRPQPGQQAAPPPGPPHGPTNGAREPLFNVPGVVLSMIALMVLIQVADSAFADAPQRMRLLIETAFIPVRYMFAPADVGGAWFWSPVTYSVLHGGWAHLALNLFWLAAFGSLVARRIGPLRFLAFWVLAAIVSAMAFLALNWGAQIVMVGASGVISALMAAAARFAFSGRTGFVRHDTHLRPRLNLVQSLTNRTVLGFLGVWFGINLLAATGFSFGAGGAAIAWEAHVGGFLFGFLAFPLFDPVRRG